MPDVHAEFELAISEVTKARSIVKKGKARQVTAGDEIDQLKAVAWTWFKTHRAVVLTTVADSQLTEVDAAYRTILQSTSKATSRQVYVNALKSAKDALAEVMTSSTLSASTPATTSDAPPDFSSLAADAGMQDILLRRWSECQRCIAANAPLAATVMMGGLLEALCVARANRLSDKSPLFKAKTTPQESKSGKPLPLKEWTLKHYLDVGHELNWLSSSGKDVGAVLRDYRNYVHPQKEYSHGVVLSGADAAMFWEVVKALSRQILKQ